VNEFSWAMADYVWPNHSWGYDVLVSGLFRIGSFPLLSIFGGWLIGLSVLLVISHLGVFEALLASGIFVYFSYQSLNLGLRSQLVSLVLFAGLTYLLRYQPPRLWKQRFWLIPGLMLVWANMHGQFVMGLGLLMGFSLFFGMGVKSETKISWVKLIAVSILVTLINPFGMELYATVLAHTTSPVFDAIFEWMPWEAGTDRFYVLVGYSLVIGRVMWELRKRGETAEWIVSLGLMMLAFKSRRFIAFYLLFTLPLMMVWVENYLKTIGVRKRHLMAVVGAMGFLVVSTIYLVKRNIWTQTWESYCQTEILCSEGVVEFMRKNNISGRIFNSYRLGGHLIYRSPDTKVFVDGRMTLWMDEEGKSPFLKYFSIIHAEQGASSLLLQLNPDYVLIHPQFELATLMDQQLKWPVAYEDEVVKLYENPTGL
jgi:hypothetical protein